jgi:uncharacterized protein YjiS (DUF1127 family)
MNGSTPVRRSLGRPFARFAEEARRRRVLRELRGFDDRMLADIGVTRSGIDFAVRHGVNQIRKRAAQTECGVRHPCSGGTCVPFWP